MRRFQRFDGGPASGRNRRNRAVATRPGEGPDSAPTRPIHGGASGNAPGSGTAELTKLEIRPDLERNGIAGWRRIASRELDARRGARSCPARRALPDRRHRSAQGPRYSVDRAFGRRSRLRESCAGTRQVRRDGRAGLLPANKPRSVALTCLLASIQHRPIRCPDCSGAGSAR